MSLHRGADGAQPLQPDPGGRTGFLHEERRAAAATRLALGTLACPLCDAPVALGGAAVAPSAPLACPYCAHRAPLRDFLSLAAPARPARVEVHVHVHPARPAPPARRG